MIDVGISTDSCLLCETEKKRTPLEIYDYGNTCSRVEQKTGLEIICSVKCFLTLINLLVVIILIDNYQ
ncbi:hypothetical protein ACJ2_26670 [Pantoea sp. QMID2]|nr:hypothetical protein ACJ1_28470 [Pantoea sp. QMID1]GME42392.1 hypothetical protein ACJ3_30260 [Pantoea sp. QMID3]GME57028.1 hypothetical protein ACJ4_24970 [Pantoea sp. QMID4]GME58746.1 hypothetical protein ACJ2_26670 [Pantoea sp. QMID2]